MSDIDTLRETEARLRATDSGAYASLRTKRKEAETAAADDVAAASAALLAGDAVPKPKAVKLHAEIRDIESRVILAVDEALWGLVAEVVEVADPDVDRRILAKNLLRWQGPDPKNPNVPARTQHLKPRPKDVVDWVLGRIAAVETSQAKQQAEDEREDRKRVATERVNQAKAEYDKEQSILLSEREEKMSVTARNAGRLASNASQQPLWPPFNRLEFLEREGLVEDYGWTQHGVSVKGGRETKVEQVPASEIGATNYTEA